MLRQIILVIAMKIGKMLATELVIAHGDDDGVVYFINRLPSRYISWWVGQQTLSYWYVVRTGDRDDECDECSVENLSWCGEILQRKEKLPLLSKPTLPWEPCIPFPVLGALVEKKISRQTFSAFQADTFVGAWASARHTLPPRLVSRIQHSHSSSQA